MVRPRTELEMLRAYCLLVVALLATGCSVRGTAVSSRLEDMDSVSETTQRVVCRCFQILAYSSEEDCVAGAPVLAEAERACVIDAYELNEAASLAYLDCSLDALRDFTLCVNQPSLMCGDYGSVLLDCVDLQNDSLSRCPALSSDVEDALDACSSE